MRTTTIILTILCILNSCSEPQERKHYGSPLKVLQGIVGEHNSEYLHGRNLRVVMPGGGFPPKLQATVSAMVYGYYQDEVVEDIFPEHLLHMLRSEIIHGIEDLRARCLKNDLVIKAMKEYQSSLFRTEYSISLNREPKTADGDYIAAHVDHVGDKVFYRSTKFPSGKDSAKFSEPWSVAYEKVYGHKPDRELP